MTSTFLHGLTPIGLADAIASHDPFDAQGRGMDDLTQVKQALLVEVGQAHRAMQRGPESLAAFAQALSMARNLESPARARARFELAKALVDVRREKDRGRELAAEALLEYTTAGRGFVEERAEIARWLASTIDADR